MRAIDISDGNKACSKCRERKPLDAFPRSANATSGRKPDCHECRANKYAETQMTSKARRRRDDVVAGLKECTRCGFRRSLEEFPVRNSTKCGVKSHCKICHNTSAARLRSTDEGKARAKARALVYNHTEAGRAVFRANSANQRAVNLARSQRYEALIIAFGVSRERAAVKRATPTGLQKARARSAFAVAVSSGVLKRSICVRSSKECSGRVHGHHISYEPDQWLVVVWLCHKHHMMVHRKAAA